MPSQRRPGLASIHIYIPTELRDEFAATVKRKGETMTDALTRAIQREIKRGTR